MRPVDLRNATLRIELSANQLSKKVLHLPARKGARYVEMFAGHEVVLATLKTSCFAVGRLHLLLDYNQPLNGDKVREVVDYVNRHCAAVPQKWHILSAKGSVVEFTAFNVTSVNIRHPERLNNFAINARFPALAELSMRIDAPFAINEHLPHLKHFELLDRACGRFDLRTFAALNPQIRSAKLDLCEGMDRLYEVNAVFPHLEALHYSPRIFRTAIQLSHTPQWSLPKQQHKMVRFPKVTSFTVGLFGDFDQLFHDHNFATLQSVQFDRLDALKYISSYSIYGSSGTIDFVGQHKELKSLDCSSYGIAYEEVWRLVRSLANLKVIIMRPNEEHEHQENVLRLMAETHLMGIRVWIDDAAADGLRNVTLPGQWTLESDQPKSVQSTALTFTRK